MNLGPFAKPAIFAIGNMRAHCRVCQGSEFVAPRRAADEPLRVLTCTNCGTQYATSDLMEQVVRKVMESADLALKRTVLPRTDRSS